MGSHCSHSFAVSATADRINEMGSHSGRIGTPDLVSLGPHGSAEFKTGLPGVTPESLVSKN